MVRYSQGPAYTGEWLYAGRPRFHLYPVIRYELPSGEVRESYSVHDESLAQGDGVTVWYDPDRRGGETVSNPRMRLYLAVLLAAAGLWLGVDGARGISRRRARPGRATTSARPRR